MVPLSQLESIVGCPPRFGAYGFGTPLAGIPPYAGYRETVYHIVVEQTGPAKMGDWHNARDGRRR